MGFLGIITTSQDNLNNFNVTTNPLGHILENTRTFKNFWMKRYVVPKFLGDKIFQDDGHLFICTDGIILNSKKLNEQYQVKSIFELFIKRYQSENCEFIKDLRGDFSGVIFDIKSNFLQIFTNHLGSKPVFYFFDEINQTLIFGSDVQGVVAAMRKLGYSPCLSETGAYCLLTFGFMLDNFTLIEQIHRLPPGSCMSWDNGRISIRQYYQLTCTPYIDAPEAEIIKELDNRFKEAVAAEYDKDLEYGYRHVATLSGGLDSRMNVTYAKKLGYQNLLNITFSQSNYSDELIAKRIAADYGYEFLFFSLDNGNYLKDIEKPVSLNDGLIFYAGAAHLLRAISFLDWDQLGLLHTGSVGEIFKGVILSEPRHVPVNIDAIKHAAYSTKLIHKLPQNLIEKLNNYENSEIFNINERGIHGALNGYRMIEHFTEYASPFLDIDFLDYSIKIHPKSRYQSKIYLKWITTHSPEAAVYPWEHTGKKITASRFSIPFTVFMKYLQWKIGVVSPRDSMNPFEYWFKTNKSLRDFFENFYSQHIMLLKNHPILIKDTEYLYKMGNVMEKTQALTLLAAVKLLMLE